MSKTKIEWATDTWNPTTGCDKVSPGCDNCYALGMAKRLKAMGSADYQTDGDPRTSGPGFGLSTHEHRLDQPLRWTKPRRIFVNSMSDLFHKDVPDEFLAKVFAVMAMAPNHTFQILTKRHSRMRSLLTSDQFWRSVGDHGRGIALERVAGRYPSTGPIPLTPDSSAQGHWECVRPLPNVWLGVSVENQQWADIRIPALLDTPAAVRFLSCEPLLGSIDLVPPLESWVGDDEVQINRHLHWVIAGGESGRNARPMHPAWARSLRDQCQAAAVPFLFKQRGEWTWNEAANFRMPTKPLTDRVAVMHAGGMTALTKRNPFDPFAVGHPFWATRIERVGKKAAGRELDGRTWDEYPAAVA